jgi:hypothetical protein
MQVDNAGERIIVKGGTITSKHYADKVSDLQKSSLLNAGNANGYAYAS